MSQRNEFTRTSRDFRMSHRPRRFEDLWNFGSSMTLRILHSQAQTNSMSQVSIFHGPNGCGKTTTARILGAWASCHNLDDTTGPCLACRGCEGAAACSESYVELNGADNAILPGIDEAYRATCYWKVQSIHSAAERDTTDDSWLDRLNVVAIDEAHRMPPKCQEYILKLVEEWGGSHVILLTSEPKKILPALMSRGTPFVFPACETEECVAGLAQAAKLNGLMLEDEALRFIAERNNNAPRGCLGDLWAFVPFKGTALGLKDVQDILKALSPPGS